MKESEAPYRLYRLVKNVALGLLVLVAALTLFGYVFFMSSVDKPDTLAIAERELASGTLRFGERAQRKAHVYMRRPADYFRGANGVLAATNERLIFIGVAPRENLESADAPPVIVEIEFPNDTSLVVDTRRVFLATTRGAVVRHAGREATFGITRQHGEELSDLARYVNSLHEVQRRQAAREHAVRAAVRKLVVTPLYYTVKRGDAISTIANTFETTEENLQRWNRLEGSRINTGQRLLVKPAG